jgi:hypothetical protein
LTAFDKTLAGLRGLGALALDLEKHVPTVPAMQAAAQKVAESFELPARPGEEELLRALRTFAAWCDGGSPPSDADWILAPWVCLQGNPRLMTRARFAEQLANHLALERHARLLKAMLHSYLRDWEECEATRAVGATIAKEIERHRSPWALRWRERAGRVGLFQVPGLVGRLADEAVSANGDVRLLLRELGFNTELASQSGLHAPLAARLTKKLAGMLVAETPISPATVPGILGFLRTGGKLRFPGERVALADAILGPFATKDLRNLEAKMAIAAFFDEVYGDPRSHQKEWTGVSADARRTITRWLARKALDLFFDILSATADPIWRWRKAFWLALERKGAIDDAWPVFGRQALEWLDRHPEQRKRVSLHAKLLYAERKQSVMLMRIGGYVVAEWSHAGSVRIWAQGDARAPSLDDYSYHVDAVRADCLFDQRHDSTAGYVWQRALADWLAIHVGVRVGINEIRPHA